MIIRTKDNTFRYSINKWSKKKSSSYGPSIKDVRNFLFCDTPLPHVFKFYTYVLLCKYLRPTCVPDEHSKSNHRMLLPLGNLYKAFFVIIISIHFFPSFLRVFLSSWFLFIFFQTFCGLATQKRYNRTFLKGLMVLHSHSKTWGVAYLDPTKILSNSFFFSLLYYSTFYCGRYNVKKM